MKIVSDKSVKIYNTINIFHNFENDFIEKLAIDLTLYFSKKKVFWIFKNKKIPEKKFIEYLINSGEEKNFVNILFLEKKLNKKKEKIFYVIMKNYGKKIIFISQKLKKDALDQSIFFCKHNNNFQILKKNIVKTIENI